MMMMLIFIFSWADGTRTLKKIACASARLFLVPTLDANEDHADPDHSDHEIIDNHQKERNQPNHHGGL